MIISGKELSDRLKAEMAAQVATFPAKYGRVPHLTVILVGNDPGSVSYVRGKGKACEATGISNTTINLPDTTSESQLLELIDKLNQDSAVDGILVQLPLPRHINEKNVIDHIDQSKDVDGFHAMNVAGLWQKGNATDAITLPCTPIGIIRMLKTAGVELDGKNVAVLGRSAIVGLPVSKLLLNENATVTICHSHTRNLAEITRRADIIIAAIGKPRFVKENMVSEGAVLIDVGVNRDPESGKLCGDADFDALKDKCSVISPVPGGVGPMTICCLMENTIECFLKKQ